LAINFFQSKDDYLNAYYNRFGNTRFNQERIIFEEDFRDQQSWQNTATSLQYAGKLGRQWELDIEGFFTRYQFDEALQARISRTTLSKGTQVNQLQNDQYNLVENAGARGVLTKKYGEDRQLDLGASWNQYQTDFLIASEIDTLLNSQGKSSDIQGFAQYEWELFDRLRLSAGGRLNYYRQTNAFYFAPRFQANYRFDSGFTLKGSYSTNYQFIRELTHENRLGQSVDLVVLSDDRRFPYGQSNNFMLGGNYQFKHWLFDVEFYHKELKNVIDHSSQIPGFGNEPLRPGTRQNYLIFVGTGTINGVDLTVGWEYPHYNGHLAYTLSKAVNSFPNIERGALIPSRDDRRHQLKWVNTWQWGHFDFSANYIYSSGRPYYDQRIIQGNRRRENVRWLPSYQRLDLGVNYQFNIGRTKAAVGLSVFNLTNNANVKYLQFIFSTNTDEASRTLNRVIGSQTDLLDRTLNMSVGLEF
jgi:outer membrane receptor protein involved in Fe transport